MSTYPNFYPRPLTATTIEGETSMTETQEDVEANSCFRIAMRAPFLALNFNNVSDPTGKVFISDGYIS